ncbi:DUF5719 family protein [Nocardiopsis sp. FIRDI 009]|uniref:DUF5719 family protein n=1 Tax=Nocardiopsis sp. FIRDI 009 TaxID=714197 RepID=UPI000E231EEC|nr:DUF5719 family protein [Nocardiopsis sp. FIRDI 009]
MRLIVENRFALFGLVALALAALFGITLVPVSDPLGAAEPGTVRPDLTARVCPAPGAESTVAAYAPRVGRDDAGRLRADVGEELTEPGTVWLAGTGEGDGPTVLRAEGSLASGLDSAQTTVTEDGVTEVRCAEPSTSTWFALPGGSGGAGVGSDGRGHVIDGVDEGDPVETETLTVHLANPSRTAATASVDVYTTDGLSFSNESRGISVPAGESVELELTELIQQSASLGVHVRTSTGRVAASLLAEHSSGAVSWVPPTGGPAERHVIPGLPEGEGTRRLFVTSPGGDLAEARVRVLPVDGDEEELTLDVPPFGSAWVTLEAALAGRPGTVVVESDVPVVAGALAEDADTAYPAAVDPLAHPLDTTAVLPFVPDGVEVELVMTALDGDAHVVVTPVGADGTQGDAVRVDLAAGATLVSGADWDLPSEEGNTVRLELLEDSGPVHTARILSTGDGWSVLPVPPAPVEVQLPIARGSMVGVVP